MTYVITDGNFYTYIDIDIYRATKTKFLSRALHYKTIKDAKKDLPYAKIILRHSTLEIKKIYKKDLDN
jgi:hypothetical protein